MSNLNPTEPIPDLIELFSQLQDVFDKLEEYRSLARHIDEIKADLGIDREYVGIPSHIDLIERRLQTLENILSADLKTIAESHNPRRRFGLWGRQ